jgi:predicted Ser/Thr protein kinase
MIGREREALSRLNGVPEVPRLVGSIDRYAFVMEYIDGISLANYQGTVPEGFFDELAEIMHAVHARGVAHCDLRSSGNAVVTSEGRPYVVDFAACVMRGRGLNPFISFLFRQFSEADDHAILILKRKHAPDKLTPEELDRLANPMPYERIAKAIGTGIRNVARKVLTGKRK